MERPLASIVIPVHNAGARLERCLGSASAQTLERVEFVCVDDGSTDGSPEVLARHAAADCRFTVVAQPCRGVSAARNAGVRMAQGEWVLFMDADDYAEPSFAERLVSEGGELGAQIAICSFDEFCEGPERHFPRESCPEGRLYGRAFSLADMEGPSTSLVTPNVWRMAFRRDFLDAEGVSFPEGLRTSEDLAFIYRALFAAERICLVPDVLYHYRRDTAGSLTRKDRGEDGLRALELISADLDRLLPESPWLERHFANLALDVLEYQLGSCAGWDEFRRLWDGLQKTWRPYAAARERMLAPRYLPFYRATADPDPGAYLFGLYAAARDARERLSFDLSLAREQCGAAEAELAEVKASRAWRLAQAAWRVSGKLGRSGGAPA